MSTITRIRGHVRGEDIDVRFGEPTTVLSGPTGAGKTTALQAGLWAFTGTLEDGGGKRVRKEADVHALLGAGSTGIEVHVHLDAGDIVHRRLSVSFGARGGRPSFSTDVEASWALALTKTRDVQAAIVERYGDVSAVDLGALLALGPKDRRTRLLELCQSQAEPWGPEKVDERLRHHIGTLVTDVADATVGADDGDDAPPRPSDALSLAGGFSQDPDEGFYEALTRCAASAAAEVRANDAAIRAAKAAIGELSRQVTDDEPMPDPDRVRVQIRAADSEIEGLQRDLGAADRAERGRQDAARRLRDLESRPPVDVDRLRAELSAAKSERAKVEATLAELERTRAPTHTQDPDLHDFETIVAEARETADTARSRLTRVSAIADELGATVDGLRSASECPTCRAPVGPEVLEALESRLEAQQTEVADAARESEDADAEVGAAVDALRELLDADAEAESAVAAARAERDERLRELRGKLCAGGPLDIDRLQRGIDAAAGADDEIRRVRAEIEAMDAADAAGTRERLNAVRQRRENLRRTLDAATKDQERDAGYRRAVQQRDEAEARKPALSIAEKAWAAVLAEFGTEAVEPFTAALARLLPSGWTASVDVAGASIYVQRPERPRVLAEGLSRGEQALFYGAAAAALAHIAGAGLRLVVVDHAESLTDEPVDGETGGLLVPFVRRLAAAVEQDLVDQVLVASGRLGDDELAALDGEDGVAVLRIGPERRSRGEAFRRALGEGTPAADVDDGDAPTEGGRWTPEDVRRVRDALDGLGAKATRDLMRLHAPGAEAGKQIAVVRAGAVRALHDAGAAVADIEVTAAELRRDQVERRAARSNEAKSDAGGAGAAA